MIPLNTKFHNKVETTSLYKAIYSQVLDTINQHTCAGDESQSFDEKTDGIGVFGKEEAAMFLSAFIYTTMKEAWEDGWRVRDKSCGRSRASILDKKHTDYGAFKESFVNELQSFGIENN